MNDDLCEFCDAPATYYADSDSIAFQDYGMPVCENHMDDLDPFEKNII